MIYNIDRDISLALVQIHECSLYGDRNKGVNNADWNTKGGNKFKRSFAQVLKEPSMGQHHRRIKTVDIGKREVEPTQAKLFFTNIPEEVKVTGLWKTFKRFGQVKDIHLPRKRDRYGKRFGFVILSNIQEAMNILYKKNEVHLEGNQLSLDWARVTNYPKKRKSLEKLHERRLEPTSFLNRDFDKGKKQTFDSQNLVQAERKKNIASVAAEVQEVVEHEKYR